MKQLIQNGQYTFTAATGEIALTGYVSVDIENFLLITNLVTGEIVFQFNSAAKGGTVATNVLTLTLDTSAMADTDELQIFYWDDTAGLTVTGPLTDTELRATPVPVSGTVTSTPSGTQTIAATDLDVRDLAFATDKVDASGTVLGAGSNNIGDVDVLSLPSIPAGSNLIGAVDNKSVPDATSTYSPSGSDSAAYVASQVVKNAPGVLYAITGYNSKTSAQFIQVHNTTSLPADTAVPVVVFRVAASSNFFYSPGEKFGKFFSTGITVCNSSTADTKTVGSNDLWLNVQYK